MHPTKYSYLSLIFMLIASALLLAVLASSTGVVNAEPLRGDATTLVINEVDADTPGTDIAEFVELYDGGTGNTSLTGYVMVLFNGTNDQSYFALDLDGYSTNTSGYLVIGNSAVATAVITFADASLQQGADAVAIYQGNATDFPNGTAVTTANLIDALVYDTSDPDDVGLLTLLNTGQPQVNEGGAGSSADNSNQRCANGSGGQRNTSTFVQIPPSPGTANNCGAVQPTTTPTPTNTPIIPTATSSVTPETGFVINEVDADTPSTDTAEFVEIYDGGTGNTSLAKSFRLRSAISKGVPPNRKDTFNSKLPSRARRSSSPRRILSGVPQLAAFMKPSIAPSMPDTRAISAFCW